MRRKALCLLSGGLDSTLAARIVLDLGIDLEAVNFVTAFCTCTPKTAGCAAAVSAARQLGIRVRTFNTTEPMIEIVKNPPHGYGKYLNPCIDCRILMFRRALSHMKETGAQFLVTGEVLGERPMSQRREAMRLIECESGTEGLVLRPLSAGLLEPSLPEREGLVEREKLLSISGRSRKPQIALAKELGLNDYPCPAGGCRLTEAGFAGKMKDLVDHTQDITPRDVQLLRLGRHFRLSPVSKAIVGRDEEEDGRLSRLVAPSDAVIEPSGLPGPTALVVGDVSGEEIGLACSIAAACMKGGGEAVEFVVRSGGAPAHPARVTQALPRERVDGLRIGALPRGWRCVRRTHAAGASSL